MTSRPWDWNLAKTRKKYYGFKLFAQIALLFFRLDVPLTPIIYLRSLNNSGEEQQFGENTGSQAEVYDLAEQDGHIDAWVKGTGVANVGVGNTRQTVARLIVKNQVLSLWNFWTCQCELSEETA